MKLYVALCLDVLILSVQCRVVQVNKDTKKDEVYIATEDLNDVYSRKHSVYFNDIENYRNKHEYTHAIPDVGYSANKTRYDEGIIRFYFRKKNNSHYFHIGKRDVGTAEKHVITDSFLQAHSHFTQSLIDTSEGINLNKVAYSENNKNNFNDIREEDVSSDVNPRVSDNEKKTPKIKDDALYNSNMAAERRDGRLPTSNAGNSTILIIYNKTNSIEDRRNTIFKARYEEDAMSVIDTERNLEENEDGNIHFKESQGTVAWRTAETIRSKSTEIDADSIVFADIISETTTTSQKMQADPGHTRDSKECPDTSNLKVPPRNNFDADCATGEMRSVDGSCQEVVD